MEHAIVSQVLSIGLQIALDSLHNQLPFSCDETRGKLLQAALKNPTKKTKEKMQDATLNLAVAKD